MSYTGVYTAYTHIDFSCRPWVQTGFKVALYMGEKHKSFLCPITTVKKSIPCTKMSSEFPRKVPRYKHIQ